MKLYAIFKNGFHKGNERANNGNDAIKNYIITSELLDFLNDDSFIAQYTFSEAVNGVHYNENIVL